MGWTKLYTLKWLLGRIRQLPPEIRAVWPDLQAQADASNPRGTICAAPGVAYTHDQLSRMWYTPIDTLEKALEIYKNMRVDEDPQSPEYSTFWIVINEDGTITLNEWFTLQDDYQRLKKYRGTEKGTERCMPKNTSQIQIQIQKERYQDNVFLSLNEYNKLIKRYTKQVADACIEFLDAYLTNNPKKLQQYKSHYKAIISWVYGAVQERKGKIDKGGI